MIGTSASVTGLDGASLGGASHSVLQVYQMSAPTNRIRGLNLNRRDARDLGRVQRVEEGATERPSDDYYTRQDMTTFGYPMY